jgi:hypothetical protein
VVELAAVAAAAVNRFAAMLELQSRADGDVGANRDYVEAMLGLQVWAHSLYQAIQRHHTNTPTSTETLRHSDHFPGCRRTLAANMRTA